MGGFSGPLLTLLGVVLHAKAEPGFEASLYQDHKIYHSKYVLSCLTLNSILKWGVRG